jgi:hypothetical protein
VFGINNVWDLILPRGLVWTESFENLMYMCPRENLMLLMGIEYAWFGRTPEEARGEGRKIWLVS